MNSTPTLETRQPHTLTPPTPFFRSGEVYLYADLLKIFSRKTLTAWQSAGLPIRRPGTRNKFVFADDLLELMRTWTPPASRSTDQPTARTTSRNGPTQPPEEKGPGR